MLGEIDGQKVGEGTKQDTPIDINSLSRAGLETIKENNIDLNEWNAFQWYWSEGSHGAKVRGYIHRETRKSPN